MMKHMMVSALLGASLIGAPALALTQEPVGATREHLQSVQQTDRQGLTGQNAFGGPAPGMTDADDSDLQTAADLDDAERTGMRTMYWLLALLALAALLAVGYTLSVRNRRGTPYSGR